MTVSLLDKTTIIKGLEFRINLVDGDEAKDEVRQMSVNTRMNYINKRLDL